MTTIWDALSEDERGRLFGGSPTRSFAGGDVLLTEGETGSSMLLLTEGEVTVTRGETELARLGPGHALGEMALLDPAPRSATVTARTAGALVELDRAELWGLLADGDPGAVKVLQALTATVCSRLADVNGLVRDEVTRPRGNVFSRLWKSVWRK